ncbi:MerR family transcriptional regulator [Cytobacillus sp. Sa5YUA1]|uniref:MerR family transcriptional regulator n=1 Tax=Cytobacillus stercorigallinarum TaxID=2762240 RepID=A0ABR8QQ03_9BACI|nr:MerR family transcriptional regulator [Cytobacillus stercorigallinarum]MBD7937568.1 MerR family transcriptional regulator [Cytobacillus stercorigallinarum]
MKTSEIAKLSKVHPNTVRLYEEWQFISPVPRKPNGYRVYSELHLKQMEISRLAFRQEFIQNNLRKKATEIVRLSGREQFKDSLRAAESYLTYLQTEYEFALKAIETVKNLLQNKSITGQTYSHKSVASMLQLTEETIRNWERNHLYTVKRNAQNRRIYTERDIQKLLVIRTLRSAHFSITSIAHLFQEMKQSKKNTDILEILQTPTFSSDFFHVTDDLMNQLKIAMDDLKSIIAILTELQ